MARQIIVIALVLFVVIGYVSANSVELSNSSDALPPVSGDDDSIGTTDDDATAPSGNGGLDEVVAGPIGSETEVGPSAESPKSGAPITLKASAVVGVAGVAGLFFF